MPGHGHQNGRCSNTPMPCTKTVYKQLKKSINCREIGDKFGVGCSIACKKLNTASNDENLFRLVPVLGHGARVQSNLSFNTETSTIREPLYCRQFAWSQRNQIPYKFYLYNTDKSIIRTLSLVPSVSVLKRFDCTTFGVSALTRARCPNLCSGTNKRLCSDWYPCPVTVPGYQESLNGAILKIIIFLLSMNNKIIIRPGFYEPQLSVSDNNTYLNRDYSKLTY